MFILQKRSTARIKSNFSKKEISAVLMGCYLPTVENKDSEYISYNQIN